VAPTVAFPHDHRPFEERSATVNGAPRPYFDPVIWAGLAGMVWLPAASAPVGLSRSGLPVGVHIVAPYLEDRSAVDFARKLADVVGGYEIPPGY
jgi:amidase